MSHAPIGKEFSFEAFLAAGDRATLCLRLALILTERLRASSDSGTTFTEAMYELRTLGHDLWSLSLDEAWGHDYMTRRPGAGLLVTRAGGCCDDDEPPSEEMVFVEFNPPA